MTRGNIRGTVVVLPVMRSIDTPAPTRRTERPARRIVHEPRRPALVIRAFAAPVVRELPPRRDVHAAGGAW